MKLPFGYTIAKASSAKVPNRPVGLIGMKYSSGYMQEEFLTELQWPAAGKVYQEMSSNDAVIGACLYLIETIIRKAHWHVAAASDDAGDIEAKDFLESCMYDMQDQSWDDFICDALSMLVYGFSFHEIVYKIRRGPQERDPKFKSNFSDGKIGWQEMPIRSQATMREWTYDESTGKITEFVQDPGQVGLNGEVKNIPIEGNLLFRTKASRGNPEGWSLLRRAYRSWYFKRYIEELEGIGIERNLAGIPVLSPPPDVPLFDDKNQEMKTMLAWSQKLVNELRQDRNHGVVLPSTDWTLKLLGAEGSSKSIDTDTIIRRHESRMAMSMLSDIVIMGGDRTGSFALAETKQGLFTSSLQAIINSIAYTLNTKAVPRLFLANNWTLEKLPTITADDLKAPTMAEVALILRSLKVDITKNKDLFNYLMNLIQAPQMTEEEFNTFIEAQTTKAPGNNGEPGNNSNPNDGSRPDTVYQDSADNAGKQSDQMYT